MLGNIVEDRYLVEAELGAGAMGHVYRARHVKVGRPVAIKVMHAELAKVPSIVERFAREARIAARLDHPNLVSVLDVGVTPDTDRLPLIVLELAPGVALTDLMLSPLPREQVVSIVRQLLRGLDHAHDAGLIHRDLKPDNILVEQAADGTLVPRIVDFGIAVYNRDDDPIAARRLTEANTVIGTPFYMSPEQALAKPLDARTDLFSLGVIMYELLAGMPPFPGSGLDVALLNATTDAPPIAERAGIAVDPLLESFVHKLMARSLAGRFRSAHDALAVLDLIEIDRIAAARALSGEVAVAPAALPARSDALSTHPMVSSRPVSCDERAASCSDGAIPVVVGTADRSDRVTQVEHVAGLRPARRRALWGAMIAAAAVTAIVGWSAGIRPRANASAAVAHGDGTIAVQGAAASLTPPSQVIAPSNVSSVRVEDAPPPPAPSAIVPSPGLRVQDAPAARTTATPVRKPAKPAIAVAPSTTVPSASPAAAAATAPTAESQAPASDSASDVAARYVRVGRLLRGGSDDLWTRYRMIRINDALVTVESRRTTLATLVDIESALAKK